MKKIKAGEVIYAKTNAELLNGLLGKHYKAYMKSSYNLDVGEMLWMPRLDGKVRAGWTNTMQNEKIIEKYVGGHPYPNNFYDGVNVKRRVVFEKCDAGRYFIFLYLYVPCFAADQRRDPFMIPRRGIPLMQ